MSDQALIQRNDATLFVTYTAEAIALKDAALAVSGVVGRVSNPEENAAAVAAQVEIQRVKQLAEKARKAAKEPVLAYGKKIDEAAKQFVEELDEEMLRVSKLVGDYQALEQAKERAAEQLRKQELDRIEKEKNALIAKASSHEQVEAIQEHFNQQAQQVSAPPQEPVRAQGQVVKSDWEIVVTHPFDLAKYHPSCVDIKPRLSEIKSLLNDGVSVRGVTATKITKAQVRVAAAKSIEV